MTGIFFVQKNRFSQEVSDFMELLFATCIDDFGFDEVILRLSTRPEKRVGSDELWEQS